MMCATGRNEEGKAECPQISKEYLSLLKGYDIATLEKGTQQTAICDKNSGEKLGVMEQGLFQRDAGIENNYYQAVSGCSCGKAESAKERTMKCKPWPKSLSVSYHDNDPNVICVDGLRCPKSK
ncbi:hypothetical protein PtA15_3A117 [Puccinia triticina]|nr:uncharacterized protein PtA15_3A117 [Puccinia triticina]WAQ82753.1 hypothetical protein PtA15_3A117 [Puccinia triticina]WAR53592.1 hypothetical protein PtB15_3B100 [Puccinia triticina]